MRVLLSVILAVVSMGIAPDAGASEVEAFDPDTRLAQALSEYARALEESDRDARLAQFARAEYGFATVVAAGAWNASLLTNLGNAALQAEHVGQAVLAYQRALRLDPDSATARQNLAHIRSLLPAWVPRPSASEGLEALFFYRRVPATVRAHFAAGSFVFAALCLAISVRRREGAWRGLAIVGAFSWTLLLASIFFDGGSELASAAVVTTDETLARSADSRLAALALPEPLPAGAEVEILEDRAEWTRIRLHNGRDVWVLGSSVTRVAN